ncbi:MAG TPA: glutamate-cysteine ligase family protein [Casimicrobiaceae bacterium]|nr:glutamate-cysteine ligase family protein [Casimicrobiaceae bacterium]
MTAESIGVHVRSTAAAARFTLPAFSAYGLELEYMIVDRDSLAVKPIAAQLLRALAGFETSEVMRGALGWSNELACHVVELKNAVPTAALAQLAGRFQAEIREANRRLRTVNARLMPTAMHPWMEPATETSLWSDPGLVYQTYDRIYGCRSHGFANVQSLQLNLPFADDDEFARLHAATRLVLPLLPAIAASSPIVEGRASGLLDSRLEAYRTMSARTPCVTGCVIPETVRSRAEYGAHVLSPMYDEIAPYDPAGILRHEWLNSRGAIPRFERGAIEMRLLDVQECPQADVAIAAAVIAIVRALCEERLAPVAQQQAIKTESLHRILLATIRDADRALVDDAPYLCALGIDAMRCRAGDAWRSLLGACARDGDAAWWRPVVSDILAHGPLARRILRAVGDDASRERLAAVYRKLCECLADGRMFV